MEAPSCGWDVLLHNTSRGASPPGRELFPAAVLFPLVPSPTWRLTDTAGGEVKVQFLLEVGGQLWASELQTVVALLQDMPRDTL